METIRFSTWEKNTIKVIHKKKPKDEIKKEDKEGFKNMKLIRGYWVDIE